jgi:monoamine oxidase
VQNVDVTIVGGGASGLAAARDLGSAGLRVVLFEARQRLGGRIHTRRPPGLPTPVELGAEFIHGSATETIRIVDAAGLAAVEIDDAHWRLTPRGFEARDFWRSVEKILSRVPGADTDAEEFLRRKRRLSSADRQLARSFVEGYHATRLDEVSVKSIATEGRDRETGNRQARILDGQDRLLRWMVAGADPERVEIRLSTPIVEIARSSRGIVITDRRGTTTRASAALVTVPVGVLKAPPGAPGAIRFSPPLPARVQRALSRIAMGHVVKIVFRFREPFWEREGFLRKRLRPGARTKAPRLVFLHAADEPFPTWWSSHPVRSGLLTAWAGGPGAEALRAEKIAPEEVALATLARLLRVPRRELDRWLEGSYSTDWSADPFSRGAYSHALPGGAEAGEALALGKGPIFFAGEATSREESGTVSGAIASGRRAARRIRAAVAPRGRI